ncbi:MAG: DEAD/DEAH box helicase family protein [Paludibacter sp.]|nr:DEAD/DEAH box helicase family protein [Paludibacter sp.]
MQTVAEVQKFIAQLASMGMQPNEAVLSKLEELKLAEVAPGNLSAGIKSIYEHFKVTKNYNAELQSCIEQSVEYLLNPISTNANNPGMLLGKIQSGKTRTFVGIIALAFDKGFDSCVVFTKGTNALAVQTVMRLKSDFEDFIDNEAYTMGEESCDVQINDIMSISRFTQNEINTQKHIIVCKKESNNLARLLSLFENHPLMKSKKVLIVDDEADFASFGFSTKEGVAKQNKISQQIDTLRGLLPYYRYLQVTATPYSLYLQPQGEIELESGRVSPIRPEFTVLVPIHDRYVGGEQYFDDSENQNSMYAHLFERVNATELDVLGNKDMRYLKGVLTSPNLHSFRSSFVNYMVAGAIRIIQQRIENKRYKSSFIIHTEIAKGNHKWQYDLLQSLIAKLKASIEAKSEIFEEFVFEGYLNFQMSIEKARNQGDVTCQMPEKEEVLKEVRDAILNQDYSLTMVNSEEDIEKLLDTKGQLKLRSSYNVFIGGFVLDRGLTIENLISFFYGRNPNNFQQDTVLQHARMYGARAKEDMAVTRLYTTQRIYNAMKQMFEFDNELREAFERKVRNPEADDSAIFICYDPQSGIRPCSPQRLLITETETLKAGKRVLPIGFQTKSNTDIQKAIEQIDFLIENAPNYQKDVVFDLDKQTAIAIIELIATTYTYSRLIDNNEGLEWNHQGVIGIIKRLSHDSKIIRCLHRTNRNMSRLREDNVSFVDAPDDGNTDLKWSRKAADVVPALMLFKENGKKEKGWRDAAFYWPVLVCPKNTTSSIYAYKQANLEKSQTKKK